MDGCCDGDVFIPSSVVIVRSPCKQQTASCGCSRACICSNKSRSSPIATRPAASNYMLKGGVRAAEERAARQEAAAWKDLKVANHALANELVRMSTHGSKEKQSLQEEVTKLELLLQAQQDRLELVQGRLADAVKHNEEGSERHHARLKEVARRLKEEHLAKLKPLQDLNEQLLSELSAKQHDASTIAALQEQLALVNHRLELEGSGRAELWQRCAALEGELQGTQQRLVTATKSLKRAEQQLERGARLEHKLCGVEEALQSEQVAHSRLQADATLERNQAALVKAELDQVHQELTALRHRYDTAEQQRASLSLRLTDAQAAVSDAAMEARAAAAKAERLQQELEMTKSEADSQASSLRSQASAREERLTAQHACRLAQLQSELDAQTGAAADSEAALAAARAQIEHLSGQVESLRQLGDAAGTQLGATQARLDQLHADKQQLRADMEQQEQQLRAQLQTAQVQLMQCEAQLSEATSAADTSRQQWGEEQGRMHAMVAKWREKAMQLQDELECKHSELVSASKAHADEVARMQVLLDSTKSDLSDTRRQLSELEAERCAAAKRSSTLMTQWEERDAARDEELAKLRAEVSELLSAGNAARCEADGLRAQLKSRDLDLEHMTLALADEQSRLAALRAQLGVLEQEKAGEYEERVRGMQDLAAALQSEQQARLEAQLDLNRQKKRVAALEAEVTQQRNAYNQVLESKGKAEEAAATSAAALAAAERKAKAYRGDSTALLSDYDTWVAGLLAKKSSSGSGGTASASGGGGAGGSLWGGGGGGAASSPAREGSLSLSRTPSQLGSPAAAASAAAAAGGLSPKHSGAHHHHQHHNGSSNQQQQGDSLERYDRIAALLENRGVGNASLTRALSGHRSTSGAMGSARGSEQQRLSPRPSFK